MVKTYFDTIDTLKLMPSHELLKLADYFNLDSWELQSCDRDEIIDILIDLFPKIMEWKDIEEIFLENNIEYIDYLPKYVKIN